MWFLRKIDSLVAAAVAAAGAAAFAQLPEFIQQYLQRLGGHLDEARLAARALAEGPALRALDEVSRATAIAAAEARVAALQASQEAIAGAVPFAKPFVLAFHADPDIAAGTWSAFKPAVPLDPVGLTYALIGLVLGWLAYEIVTGLLGLLMPRRAQRGRMA
jgi:hypothetical protein